MTDLILASSSKQRLDLLKNIDINPTIICSPDIEETVKAREKPEQMALRLAKAKIWAVNLERFSKAYVIAADTVVATKSRVFDKALTRDDVEQNLKFFSGRKIRILSAVSVALVENGCITKQSSNLVCSILKYKRISKEEINHYLSLGYGIGTSGGVEIQGFGQTLLQYIHGSYSGVIGLPLEQTVKLLNGLGYVYPARASKN
jgi:septum formation protein